MPVVYEGAQPFSAPISEGAGATDQWNKTFPTLAGLYESSARNRTQQEISRGENETRASIASADNQSRGQLADAQNQYRRVDQEAETAARERINTANNQAQERAQLTQFAMQDAKVSQQERMHYEQQQSGLFQIQNMMNDGLLTPQEAGDAIYHLKTGIDMTKQRLQAEQEKDVAAQTQMRNQQVASDAKNQSLADKFRLDMALKGITVAPMQDRSTGKWHDVAVDPKTGRIYNPFLEHMGKGDQDQQPKIPFSTKTGEFDLAAATKDAKLRAEADPDFHTMGDTGKPVMKAEGYKWIHDRVEGLEREFYQKKNGQAMPANAADQGQQAQAANDQRSPSTDSAAEDYAKKIQTNPNMDGMQKSQAMGTYKAALALRDKPNKTAEDLKQLQEYRDYLAQFR